MKRLVNVAVLALFAGFAAYGCTESGPPMGPSEIPTFTPQLHTAEAPFVTQLIADGGEPPGIDVGEVRVWNDGDNLYVMYVIDADLTPGDVSDDGVPTLIYETHLAVATSLSGIPQTKKGNPTPGQFPYSTIHDPGVTEFMYMIPLAWDPGTALHIAAHAVVKKLGGLAGLELALPPSVTMSVTYPYGGGPAYFPHTYVSGETTLDGDYYGWCVDTDNVIYQNTNYTANVYSSYEDLPEGTVEYPGNLDLVNWILNQNYVGQTSPGGYGTYTYGDVQRAIWTLVEDNLSGSGLGQWSQLRVNEILAAAQSSGDGFEPGCGDVVAVILVPVTEAGIAQVIIAQVTLIDVGVPCYDIDETAWGEGAPFDGNQWGMYFTYIVQPPPPPPLSGYGVVTSGPTLNYADGGWAGWSVPTDKIVTGGGFVLTGGPAAVSAPGTPESAWPHYTFGTGEYGWVVRDDPDGASSHGSAVYAVYADMPLGYEIVTSGPLAFSDGGYGGWSCPAGKVVIGGGFVATDAVAVSAPGTPGSVWPHYTFGPGEYGWVVRDAQNSASNTITLYAICASPLSGYEVVNSVPLNYSDGGWAGWSCPAGKVVTGGGFKLTGGPAAVSAPGTPGSVWPHYTFGTGEYGWVVRDDPDGASSSGSTVYAVCAEI
jgi:hypothetical protein